MSGVTNTIPIKNASFCFVYYAQRSGNLDFFVTYSTKLLKTDGMVFGYRQVDGIGRIGIEKSIFLPQKNTVIYTRFLKIFDII